MATTDLTRALFEPRKRYAGVLHQQGRVVTDDDRNEAHHEDAEDTRRTRLDVIGPAGSPDEGFKVEAATLAAGLVDFEIRAGTMYVGGLPVRLDHDTTFAGQPDWPGIADDDRASDAALPAEMVYLEVFQQVVSAAEDRETAEPALGGPDTTTRVRTMGRVRRQSVAATDCAGAWAEVVAALAAADLGTWDEASCELRNDLRLQVSFVPGGAPEDLCSPSVTAGYLGAENQALRVQLVDRLGGVGDGELTWGFDNGGPLYRAVVIDPDTLVLETSPRDESHWPLLGQTVEVLPWGAVLVPDGDPTTLHGEVLADGGGRAVPAPAGLLVSQGGGHLTTLTSSWNPSTGELILADALPAGFNALGAEHLAAGIDTDHDGEDRAALVFVRIWQRGSDLSSPARIAYSAAAPVTLGNTGVAVTLTGNDLGADAAWIIAARPSTPDAVYPWALEDGRAANELRRFLAPLAVIEWNGGVGDVHDCRETFPPLTRMRTCCRYTVGDGQESHGDFATIQEAIDNLPAAGGEVCVLPGRHTAPVRIVGLHDITVHGCGTRSLITVAAPLDAVFFIDRSQRIRLESLAIQTDEGFGVQINDDDLAASSDIALAELRIDVRDRSAVFARNVIGLEIEDCDIEAAELVADPAEGSEVGRLPLVFVQGDELQIDRNRIAAPATINPARRVAGGLQVGGDSASVRIRDNRIDGGSAHGITLGSVRIVGQEGGGFFFLLPFWFWDGNCLRQGVIPVGGEFPDGVEIESAGPLRDVQIDRNVITGMGGDGIGVAWFFEEAADGGWPSDAIAVATLRITSNRIEANHLAERAEVSPFVADSSGHGGIALAVVFDGVIEGNRIERNGAGLPDPVCGVFLLLTAGATIERNRVLGNGRTGESYAGWRGGIVVPLAAWAWDAEFLWDGRAAVRVADNQVAAPDGPALYLAGVLGTIEVLDNELVTRAGMHSLADVPAVTLGMSVIIAMFGPPFERFDTDVGVPVSPEQGAQVTFSGNQVCHMLQEPEAALGFTSVFVFSLDDVHFSDNVVRCDLGDSGLLFATLVAATTLQAADNRLRETPRHAFASMLTLGAVNQTSDNLGTHCIFAMELLTASFVGLHNRSIVDLVEAEYCPQLDQFGAAGGGFN
jgi:hypothetical protein